jgi:hypothetical protein
MFENPEELNKFLPGQLEVQHEKENCIVFVSDQTPGFTPLQFSHTA